MMRYVATLAAFFAAGSAVAQAPLDAYVGQWDFVAEWAGNTQEGSVEVTKDGQCRNRVGTGVYTSFFPCAVKDGVLSWTGRSSQGKPMVVTLRAGSPMTGGAVVEGQHHIKFTKLVKK